MLEFGTDDWMPCIRIPTPLLTIYPLVCFFLLRYPEGGGRPSQSGVRWRLRHMVLLTHVYRVAADGGGSGGTWPSSTPKLNGFFDNKAHLYQGKLTLCSSTTQIFLSFSLCFVISGTSKEWFWHHIQVHNTYPSLKQRNCRGSYWLNSFAFNK
jgi:expansin (peptidoglycan-binding protein)